MASGAPRRIFHPTMFQITTILARPRAGFLAPILIVTACAGARTSEVSPGSSAPDTAELEALFHARQDSARMRFNQADVDFMTGMIAHHAQALVMARLAPSHGASEPIRVLTSRIINAQRDEIATMQTWLRDRGQPVPEIHIDGLQLTIHGAGGHHMMPGMLTPEQLRDLDASRGPDFDRKFLTYMIQHHEGAVTMVHDLFATDGAAQGDMAFKLASDIQADQTTEIARMQLMLDNMRMTDSN